MSMMQVNGSSVALNPQGFLSDFHGWNEEIAIAEEQGLELTECHWKVIGFLREYYEKFETPPSPKQIVTACGERITKSVKCRTKDLHELFHTGGCKLACKLAGLPRQYCNAC
jgi:tRNA 2-thiouridine synthesizing protein E